ncbi:hypothetical protein ABFA07_008928 [Porites harrisoni]
MESSQDARSGREENLQSIISKITDDAGSIPDSGLDESDFLLVATEHSSFKRKTEQDDSDEVRKIPKEDLGSDVKFISDEIKQDIDSMPVQIFHDLPGEGPFPIASSAQGDVLIHDQTQPVFQPLAIEDPHNEVTHALEDSLDNVQVSANSPIPMPQVALGLIPNKDVLLPEQVSAEQVTLQFQKKLEDLEQQVKVLQNRNLALEESYKKLSDLVEAQNHLLASGGPIIQRLAPTTPQEVLDDTTNQKEPSGASPTTPTPKVPQISEKLFLGLSQQASKPAVQSYELPRRVSAKEVLNLWENGCDEFPPIKDWTPTQKLKQQSKISRWKKLVDIFKADYHGDMKSFEESFSDARGEVLPVTTILSLYETQQTPAFLGRSRTELDETVSSSGDNSQQEADDEGKKRVRNSLDSESEDVDDGEGNADSKVTDSGVTQPSTEVRYYLPRKVTPKDIVRLWEEGCEEFPPVCQWTRAQKIGQETKIFRWRKIVEIFNKDCNRSWDHFYGKYANDRGHLMAISSIIAKYDAENATSGPIFDIPEARSRLIAGSKEEDSGLASEKLSATSTTPLNSIGEVKVEDPNPGEGTSHILPRKVTAKDIIKLWETGYGDLPPLHKWTPAQKSGQRSKFSRWTKIYDIYKYHCKGDMSMFESKFSDERGELYPVTTIVAMFDACESPSSLSSPFSGTMQTGKKAGEGSDTEIYQLPRKVTAKEVVQLWEEGCELFPPVSKWQKIHKVGHETKLFRWKKIVDIFRKDCGGSWEKFEERFSNPKGELLPVSAILSKYDLENEPPSYLPKGFASSLTSFKTAGKDQITRVEESLTAVRSKNDQLVEDENKEFASDSEMVGGDSSPQKVGAEFILPKKVTALDVIYLWENGMGDMPPLCQWTPTQKASQRSKISRWNKIVDIFKYECNSDIRKFEEKYRDEKGELLPITNILNLHDAHDKVL